MLSRREFFFKKGWLTNAPATNAVIFRIPIENLSTAANIVVIINLSAKQI
jgi:hypothetical protein